MKREIDEEINEGIDGESNEENNEENNEEINEGINEEINEGSNEDIVRIEPREHIRGIYSVPGDKSISHRAVIFSSIAEGESRLEGILLGEDCLATIECVRALGVRVEVTDSEVVVHGRGLNGLQAPRVPLDCKNSGTTMRLLAGILAAQPFDSILTGDASLLGRPMERIIEPLTLMGAEIESTNGCAPLRIKGNPTLRAIDYRTEVSSAQVKSCILLAGLYARGITRVTEPVRSRDHTELLLKHMGVLVESDGCTVSVLGRQQPIARPVFVCGDLSSAAYIIAAAAILENSEVIITNVLVNPTRTGILDILMRMGVDISVMYPRTLCGETVADIKVRTGGELNLRGVSVGGGIIPTLIDELPLLAVVAVFARGVTVISGASELKIKESDRISAVSEQFSLLGADISATDDGFIINGNGGLRILGGEAHSVGDHRIAMSLAVLAFRASKPSVIGGISCVRVSFPEFFKLF